jgi:hypothetical protein
MPSTGITLTAMLHHALFFHSTYMLIAFRDELLCCGRGDVCETIRPFFSRSLGTSVFGSLAFIAPRFLGITLWFPRAILLRRTQNFSFVRQDAQPKPPAKGAAEH